MYQQFEWTELSINRNAILRRFEPIQPFVLICLAEKLACEEFIDVGANIGAYSLFLSRLPTIREVHAFEPSPDSYRELKQNIVLNGLSGKIITHQQAASASRGSLTFGMSKPLSGTNSVVSTSIHEASSFERQIEVESIRLDDAMAIRGQRICLKIDVEGHEREALLGMRELLSRNTVVVQIEHYEGGRDYMSIFAEAGFRKLFQLGPDLYLTNAEFTEADAIEVLERASALMIEAAKRAPRTTRTIHIRAGKWLDVQLDGPLAKAGRSGRSALRRLFKR